MIVMQTLPEKEQEEMRQGYVNSKIASEAMKMHINNWLEHLKSDHRRDDPMDVSSMKNSDAEGGKTGITDNNLAKKLTEDLDALREKRQPRKEGDGRNSPRNPPNKGDGRATPRGGRDKDKHIGKEKMAKKEERATIKGKCWNCGKTGHPANR